MILGDVLAAGPLAALALVWGTLHLEERRDRKKAEATLVDVLERELAAARVRTAQAELMLDSVRSNALEIPNVADRDSHLLVSAPAFHAKASGAAVPPIHDLELSIDQLPPQLRDEVRAIEGDDLQREYVETIQRELAGGAGVEQLHERLFGV